MKFTLTVEMNNAAFEVEENEDAVSGRELARILKEAASRIHGEELESGESGTVRDINGNNVGYWQVVES